MSSSNSLSNSFTFKRRVPDLPDGLDMRLLYDSHLLWIHQLQQSREIVTSLWGHISRQVALSRERRCPLLVVAVLDSIGQSPYARQISAATIKSFKGVHGRFGFVFPDLGVADVMKTYMLRDLNTGLPTVAFREFESEDDALTWVREALPANAKTS